MSNLVTIATSLKDIRTWKKDFLQKRFQVIAKQLRATDVGHVWLSNQVDKTKVEKDWD